MITTSPYALVAQVRRRELPTRLALAAFIGLFAWVAAPSHWPLIWFVLVLASQGLDWLVFRPVRLAPETEVGPGRRILCCASSTLNVLIYSSIAAYLWFSGGEAGRVFAMIQVAGGLLHVSLHMQHSRALLLSTAIPHGLYFLGLPIVSAAISGTAVQLLIAVGGLLYLAHLVAAVRQSSRTTRALREAGDLAETERRKAEVASAAKSDFLAVISHEIRTPMNAVISAANLLRRTRLDRDQREHVDMLMDAGDVLLGLLNDVLDFSKIEAGRMQLEEADLDLRDKLSAMVRLWDGRAAANGVRMTLDLPDDLPERVRTDPLRFQQILFNLLSNAVKFTSEGTISITAAWRAPGRLEVAVADTGCGIPADRLARVFDGFEQVDAGTTRRFGGTGLGLTISRRLAELMGGDLYAESAPGRGSTFTLGLPMRVVAAAAAPVQAQPGLDDQGLVGRSILAADDHEVNRRILNLLLAPHGCRLTLVENGAEAVEAAAAERFDAILMDMQMPVMDGLEATRRIRAGVNGDVPVIALTANAMDVHRAAWDEAGVYAFLTKPIDPPLLAQTLAMACAEPARATRATAVA
ncbi:MAG: response regulator [Brevundimonas sp.]|uniref:ATP-binding protein n=1 Tax=Brevundimonas sp. TaxID=1871086 RepID=UPI0025C61A58|nr:ATP-binding protein [Brevundimonas sp.]MBX3477849.1 response regulator [Brevundimonas sp.]